MFPSYDISYEIPKTLLQDIYKTVKEYKEKPFVKVRVIRLNVNLFSDIIDKVIKHNYTPFTPVIYGIPVEPWEKDHIGVFAVADDNTQITTQSNKIILEEV